MNNRTKIWAGALSILALSSLGAAIGLNSGVVGLATGDAGSGGGCNAGPTALPSEKPSDVNKGTPLAAPRGGEGPSDQYLEAFYVEDMYTLKLTVQAAAQLTGEADDLRFGVELQELLAPYKAGNPTFHFHDGDSPLIERYIGMYETESHAIGEMGDRRVDGGAEHNANVADGEDIQGTNPREVTGRETYMPREVADHTRNPRTVTGKDVDIARHIDDQAPPDHPVLDEAFHNPHNGMDRIVTVQLSGDREAILDTLAESRLIEWSEPVVLDQAASINDAYYGYQWNMSTLRADDIWAITDGEGATVAVLDTGVSMNTDGIARLLADQCRDFVNQTACVPDAHGHGTHVAGTIAQKNDNGIGVTGLAPGVSVLPIRVLDDNGMGRSIDIAAGIVYAVDQGADVINLSLGGYIESEARYQAIQYALDQGVTVVASTGNQGFTHTITFPAAYEGVIAVGAVNMAGEVTGYSNKHQKIPVILAPGGDLSKDDDGDGVPDGILQESLVDGNWGFYAVEGTSSAAAHVSAAAALLHAAGLTKPSEIRGTLLDTRDNLNTVSPLDALRTVRPTESHPMPGPQ
jgi:hypothetical protein